jgi:DNA-binding transcriptional regulator PaaX
LDQSPAASGRLLKQVRIPTELAGKLATVLRESQTDKEKFVRNSMLRLQQQQMLLRSKLDRVYEYRLSDAISDELWTTKSGELQEELRASASGDGASRGRQRSV